MCQKKKKRWSELCGSSGVRVISQNTESDAGCKSALRSKTFKMTTKPVLTRDCLDYRGSRIGITSQFLDCDRVGGQGAEREAKQRREERDGQALASVMDWAEGWQHSFHTWRRHVWTHWRSIGENRRSPAPTSKCKHTDDWSTAVFVSTGLLSGNPLSLRSAQTASTFRPKN